MVFGLILLSLDISKPQTFFSIFFNQEGNDDLKNQRIQIIVKRVLEEFSFRKASEVSTTTQQSGSMKDLLSSAIENMYTKGSEEGAFSVPAGNDASSNDVFMFRQKFVLWKQVASVAYILICDPEENRSLGAYFLNMFVRIIDDHFKKPGISAYPREFLTNKPEEFMALLHVFLPNGQLLFINTQFAKYLKKEVDSLLLSK